MFVVRRCRVLIAAAALSLLVAGGLPASAATGEIRIVRDRFGVPHVYGPTAVDVSYGAGYALAQDRLWQMHIYRLVAKGRLAHLLGPVVVAADRTVRFWTYTAAERAARFATYPADIKANMLAFVDGVNAHIAEIRKDPSKLPIEFAQFGEPLENWHIDDSVALSDYLIYTFGSGGGSEIGNAALLQSLRDKFKDEAKAQAAFDDLVWINDPDAPLSIPEEYDWRAKPSHARPEADAKALTPDLRISTPEDRKVVGATPSIWDVHAATKSTRISGTVLRDYDAMEQGRAMLERIIKFGSNAQIVSGTRTETGNTAQQAGPQVGYFVPQALVDFGLHSADGKLDATGMTFAGAGPAVLIGRGTGYAWTTTTGASDLTDTFVETLNPTDRRQYLFDPDGTAGPAAPRWERMECRIEVHALRGAGFENQEVCRTRHGPVLSFDLANNKAYALRYAWMNQEGGTVEGFFRFNEARSLEDFATYANLLASNHNMFYSDDKGNIGYWHPGMFPVRPAGKDLRLPLDGRGDEEWLGVLKADEVPHAIDTPAAGDFDQGWLANWNNKPAVDWDRENGWGAVHGVQTFLNNLDEAKPALPDPTGGLINADRQVGWNDLNANIRYAAFRDFNADFFAKFLPASSADAREQAALEVLRDYNGFIYDSNGDGFVDSAGYTILGRFVTELRRAVFDDDLGSIAGRANTSTLTHVMNPDARLAPAYDWLNGESRSAVAARAFATTVKALATQFKSDDPRAWKSSQPEQKYTRLNSDLATDIARSTAQGQARAQGLDPKVLRPGNDPVPGNVPNHIRMNRGTYNHLVVYNDEPAVSGPLGQSRVDAGSVIAPGQSGFTDLLGRESAHYRDQFDLYVQWRYKPMPMTLAESRAVAASEVTLTR